MLFKWHATGFTFQNIRLVCELFANGTPVLVATTTVILTSSIILWYACLVTCVDTSYSSLFSALSFRSC
jgi:hypothetical protein